jgi:hypothetical protein
MPRSCASARPELAMIAAAATALNILHFILILCLLMCVDLV